MAGFYAFIHSYKKYLHNLEKLGSLFGMLFYFRILCIYILTTNKKMLISQKKNRFVTRDAAKWWDSMYLYTHITNKKILI